MQKMGVCRKWEYALHSGSIYSEVSVHVETSIMKMAET
jgi:hypothetical protein